jgi:hypothetical protein
MTTLNELNAISPIDGRYRNKTIALALFFRRSLDKMGISLKIFTTKETFASIKPIYRQFAIKVTKMRFKETVK